MTVIHHPASAQFSHQDNSPRPTPVCSKRSLWLEMPRTCLPHTCGWLTGSKFNTLGTAGSAVPRLGQEYWPTTRSNPGWRFGDTGFARQKPEREKGRRAAYLNLRFAQLTGTKRDCQTLRPDPMGRGSVVGSSLSMVCAGLAIFRGPHIWCVLEFELTPIVLLQVTCGWRWNVRKFRTHS